VTSPTGTITGCSSTTARIIVDGSPCCMDIDREPREALPLS
jgi:hypothetical protein